MIRDLGESVLRLAADDPCYDVDAHYEIASGLTRPDYFNWPAALAADLEATDAEVVVVMFGANDGQGIVEPDGTVHQRVTDPGWQAEYARRVGAVMDQLHAADRLVLWVLQPPMRDGEFDARIEIINDVFVPQPRTGPGSRSSRPPRCSATPTAPTTPAQRQGDGIHLSREGADLLAQHLLDLIAAELPDPASTTTTTTTPDD